MEPVVDEDARGLADTLVANHDTLLAAECRELVLAAAWADLHPAEAVSTPVMPGMERPRRYGGARHPGGRGVRRRRARALVGLLGRGRVGVDRRRAGHPTPTPAAVGGGLGGHGPGVAGPARRETHPPTGLSLAQARAVDAATTPYLGSLPFGRFRDLLEARIITADPAAAEARRKAAELDRFVVTGQSCEQGLKTLVAKATAGEIIYLVAVIDRIAEVLLQHGDPDPVGVRRSKALGIPLRATCPGNQPAGQPR